MRKKSGVIVVGVLAIVIGIILSVQVASTQNSEVGGLVPVTKAQGYETELKKVRTEKDAALQQLAELEDRIDKIEKEKADEDYVVKSLLSDQEKYKMAAGVVDVKGPGVIITVDDPIPTDEYADEESTIMVHSELLLSLVNKLKDAGAEAISVNGQRILATTEISLAGQNVNINTVPTAPPYIVKAIGNPDTIVGALTIRYGIIEEMKGPRYGLRVSMEKQNEIQIDRYSGVIRFRYAQPIPSEEKN